MGFVKFHNETNINPTLCTWGSTHWAHSQQLWYHLIWNQDTFVCLLNLFHRKSSQIQQPLIFFLSIMERSYCLLCYYIFLILLALVFLAFMVLHSALFYTSCCYNTFLPYIGMLKLALWFKITNNLHLTVNTFALALLVLAHCMDH